MRYRIRDWDKYQHYRNRNPPWIKLHFELLTSPYWVALNDASRVLAITCMLIASRNDGEIDGSAAGLAYLHRVAYLNTQPNLQPLIDSGFLIPVGVEAADASVLQADASVLQADASTPYQNARPEIEEEEEEEIEKEEESNTAISPSDMAVQEPERPASQAPPAASPAARCDGDDGHDSKMGPELPQDGRNGAGRVITPEDAQSSSHAKPGARTDPLQHHKVLADYYPQLWDSIMEAHPHVKRPAHLSTVDHKARDALDKLARIDGYPEEEIVEVLRWVFEEADSQAEFWRGVILSPASLRAVKGGDGVTKFAKLHAQWQRRQPAAIIGLHWEGDPNDIF